MTPAHDPHPLATDDFHEVCMLKARYFRLLDTKDWNGWRQLFADDLVVYGKGEPGPHSIVFSSADARLSSWPHPRDWSPN